jgi:hypothetical protein
MKKRFFLRPNKANLTLSIIFTLLSLIIVTGLEWTTKMTWNVNRGFPFPIVKIFDYVKGGSCPQYNICLATNIQNFYPSALLLDLLVWYLFSCAVVLGYKTVTKQSRR